jgi:hypothetical protein
MIGRKPVGVQTQATATLSKFCPCGLGCTVRVFGAGWLFRARDQMVFRAFPPLPTNFKKWRHKMSNMPAHKIKLGLTTATIWKNEGSYSVDIARSYKNGDGDWKNTSGYFHSDLLNVAKCAERAEIWISRQLSVQS